MPFARKSYSRPLFARLLAAFLIPILLFYTAFPPSVVAQTFRTFEQSRDSVDNYVDRATRLENAESWTNYVDLGIATERVAWEQEAFDELAEKIEEIESGDLSEDAKEAEIAAARGAYEDAASDWTDAAESYIEEERGAFRAEKEGATIDVAQVSDATYIALIAEAEAAVAATAAIDLDGWEAAIDAQRTAIVAGFETELADELARVRTDAGVGTPELDGAELAAFEAQLDEIADEVRREFETRDNFFITRARNRYIALKRGDDLNAKLTADDGSAESVSNLIIEDTLNTLNEDTRDLMEAAQEEMANLTADPSSPDFSAAGMAWEQRMEAVIDAGLRAWERSEEDLYKRRLEWQQQVQTNREEGERIWQENHEALKTARDSWLTELQTQITAGREQWEAKIAEFRDSRERAEQELAEYIQTERERRDAVGKELSGIVNGGGSALLEAKDAYRYYNSLIEALEPPGGGAPTENRVLYDFYVEQRAIMSTAVGSYQDILAGSENVLYQSMHSGEDHTGFLNDVRFFAGTLKTEVMGLDVDDYETDLKNLIEAKGEEFTLYRRDIEDVIAQNALFHGRAEELKVAPEFKFNDAADEDALLTMVGGLDRKYDEHRAELEERLAERKSAFSAANDPDGSLAAADDPTYVADLLTALKAEVNAWMATATDRDARLKEQATAYFNEGLGGYYLTGNEGDPYYMSRAEYEWELLRRERNQLAKELERAEAVKEYADQAFQYEAGIEMAAVTAERTEIAKIQQDIKEVSYKLLQGDIAIDPAARTDDAVRDAEFDRIMSERGIDVAALLLRKDSLERERALVADIVAFDTAGGDDAPDASETTDLVAALDLYLDDTFGSDLEDADRVAHPFTRIRAKLNSFSEAINAGTADDTLGNQWTSIQGGANAVGDLFTELYTEYDFANLATELVNIRTNQLTMQTLGEIQDDMKDITAQIEANAELLRLSHARLEEAKEAYRQARLDFDIIRAGNSADLIKNDVINNTSALAGVIQRMTKIEGAVPIFGGQDMDALAAERAEFSHEVSAREQADNDATVATRALVLVDGLSLARERTVKLDAVLGASLANVSGKTGEEIAELLIAAKADLVKSDAGDAERSQNSEDGAVQSMAVLEAGVQQLKDLDEAKTKAIDDGESAAEIAFIETQIITLNEALLRASETLIASIRGEEKARSEHLLYYLEASNGGDSAFDREATLKSITDDLEVQYDAARDLARDAAQALATWLDTNHKDGAAFRGYDELLTLINTQITPRELEDQTGYGNAAPATDTARAELLIIRDYLLNNRAALEAASAAPGSDEAGSDTRTEADKWASVLAGANTLADSHGTYDAFEASIPDDLSDAWVTAYVAERNTLKSDLTTLLGNSDAGLAAALNALPSATRETILQYGGWSDSDLRSSLTQTLANVEQTLAQVTTVSGMQAAFRQEAARETMQQLAALEPDIAQDSAELARQSAARGDAVILRDRLQEKLDADASRSAELSPQIAAAQAEIDALDTSIATLRASLETRQLDYAKLSAQAGEAMQPGSSLQLFETSKALMHGASQNAATGLWLLGQVGQDESDKTPTDAIVTGQSEQLLGIIGYYQTSVRGDVLRDGDGNALVDATFLGGAIDPTRDIFEQIKGDMRGDDLVVWASAINDYLKDEEKSRNLEPEVRAAAGLLEDAIRQITIAETFIDMRDRTAADIEADGRALKTESGEGLSKLNLVRQLEDDLKNAIVQAQQSENGDPIAAALAVLENPANLRKFRLFSGFDASGAADGVTDAAAQEKMNELATLAAELRELRLQSTVQALAGQYASGLANYVSSSANPYAYAPDRETFIESQPVLDGDAIKTELAAIPGGDGYRGRLEEWLGSSTASQMLFAGELYTLLATSSDEGDDLQTAVNASIDALNIRLSDEIGVYLDAAEHDAERDANLEVTTSVENLISAYSTRGSDVRTELQPVIDALPDLDAVWDSRTAVEDKLEQMEAAAESSAQAGILREVRRIMNESSETLILKTEVSNYLASLTDPDAAAQNELRDELYAREVQQSLAIFGASATYKAEDYPEELREVVLLHGYQRAAERYADYQAGRASDLAAERDATVLNLTGLNGDLATHFMLSDFADWQAANSFSDYMSSADAPSIAGYLNGYYTDHNTAPQMLPGGGAALHEKLALSEYNRLTANIGASDIQAVDESAYPADFQSYILLQKFQDYASTNGLALSGADTAAKISNFERDFDTFLASAAGTVGGKSLGQRLLTTGPRDDLFVNAYRHLSTPFDAGEILPGPLLSRYIDAELGDPFQEAADRLPADLIAISGYATADYRAQAAGVSAQTEAALARIEVAEAAMGGSLSVSMTDAELNAVLTRAGYDGVSAALQNELKTQIQNLALAATYSGAGSVEAAVAGLRQSKVLTALLPTEADRQALSIFTAGEGERLSSIQSKVYTALGDAHADLQKLAGEQHGATIAMLIEGPGHALYGAQTAELQTAIDAVRAELFGPEGAGLPGFTADEKTALAAKQAEYETYFQLQSEQQLAASGVFAGVQSTLDAVLIRSGTAAEQQALKDNQPAAIRAMIESIYVEAGVQGSISAESSAFIASATGLDASIARTIAEMDPALKDSLLQSPVLINRVLDNYLETAAERAEIAKIFEDPAAINPDANLQLGNELAKSQALLNTERNRLTTALGVTVSDHRRYYAELDSKYRNDAILGEELITFAQARGDDMLTSRFSHYRTYLGVDQAYVPGTEDERKAGRNYLEYASMGLDSPETILDAGTYKDLITSDSNATGATITDGSGETYGSRGIKTVSSINAHNWGDNHDGAMRNAYHENLANNYLDSISNLNNVLNNLWSTAKLAEHRKTEEKTFIGQLAAAFDPNAADLTAAKDAITALKVDASSRQATHSNTKISERQDDIGAMTGALKESGRDFAGAGRRNQLRNMALTAYLEKVYRGVATEMDAAEQEYNALSATAETYRDQFTAKNQEYARGLEDLAQRSRELEAAADNFTTKTRVQEYAETPYLYAKTEDADGGEPNDEILTEWHGDAEEEYERARAMLDLAQNKLNDASFKVQTEDRLPEFMNVVALWEAGGRVDLAELSDDEKTELAELRERAYSNHETLDLADANTLKQLEERELFQRNKELIKTRAEHIKHTMRLVRISKAKELIEAEITRRRMIAQEKEAQFKRELSARFKVNESEEAGVDARNAVYARMAMLVENGDSFYNEFKSWYWGSRDYISDFAGNNAATTLGSLLSTHAPMFTINQIIEGASGQWLAGHKPGADKAAIGQWMSYGGSMAEFSGFRQIYFQFALSIGIWDQKKLEYEITKATWDPVSQAGQQLVDLGNRIPFGGGGGFIQTGNGMKGQASTEILKAELQYRIAEHVMRRMYKGANEMAEQAKSNTIRVMEAQSEYEDALAELYYFTRVPNQQVLKERLIQYGQQNAYEQAGPGDTTTGAIYLLTEEDLAYMFDDSQGKITSAGAGYDPATYNVDEAEMLNVEHLKYEVEYRDAFGRRYTPHPNEGGKPGQGANPGPLEGGFYRGGDGNYTRIKAANHNQSKEYRYAKAEAEDAPMHSVYDMGAILETTMSHAENLREDRRQKYYAAGDAVTAANADEHLTFSERDKTFQDLFYAAAGSHHGGREFTGYRVTYDDYISNSMQVQTRELQQSELVQKKEWDLKEQELMTQYQNWEKRIATIMERGQRGWADAESQFLQKQRQWKREMEQDVAAAEKAWDEEIKAHFTKKQDWENDVRAKSAEATIEKVLGDAVDSLNAQLSAAGSNTGSQLDLINKTAMINEAVAEMKGSLPKGAEALKSINKNIANFNTNLSISEMIGANVEADVIGLSSKFRSQMKEHQSSMKVLANVKIFEQYRKMIDDFKYSITVQNEEIEAQTTAAALAEGYQKEGDLFTKEGNASDAYGVVNAYKWFDVDRAMDQQLQQAGFAQLSDGDLVNFLENQSTTEVEAYFYTQKLAVQTAIGNIQGHGTGQQRQHATDEHTLGMFGAWVGRASSSIGGDTSGLPMESLANRAAGGTGNAENNANVIAAAGAGFGELGQFGQRPGGAPLGFYPQLGVMSRQIAKIDNEWIENGKALRRSENFETPDDLKGDAFDQLGERMESMDNLNRAWQQSGGDIGKMWSQGHLDSYDTGLMKHSDFQAQQTAFKNKYYIQDPNPGAKYGMSRKQWGQLQEVGQKAQDGVNEMMHRTGRMIGAVGGVVSDPFNPAKWTEAAGTMADVALETVADLYVGTIGDLWANVPGAEKIADIYQQVEEGMEGLGDQISETANHWSREIEMSNDPIMSTLRQIDPVRMIRNSVMNVEIARQVHGRDAGYMWEAQLISAIKTPMKVAGGIAVGVGVGLGWTGVGIGIAAAGAALIALANSIQVDVKTGKRGVKMTDQAAIATAVGILAGAAGGIGADAVAADKAAEMGIMELVKAQLANNPGAAIAENAGKTAGEQIMSDMISSGIQTAATSMFKYNAKGQSQGLVQGDDATNALIDVLSSMGTAGAMGGLGAGKVTTGSAFGDSLMGHAVGTFSGAVGQSLKYSMGTISHSQLDAHRSVGLAGLGALGSAGIAQLKANWTEEGKANLWNLAREAQKNGQGHEAVGILRGLGYRDENDQALMKAMGQLDAEIANEKFLAQKFGKTKATNLISNIRRANKQGFGEWNDDYALIEMLEEANGGEITMKDILEYAEANGLEVNFDSPEFKQAAGALGHEQMVMETLKANPHLEYKNGKFVEKPKTQEQIDAEATRYFQGLAGQGYDNDQIAAHNEGTPLSELGPPANAPQEGPDYGRMIKAGGRMGFAALQIAGGVALAAGTGGIGAVPGILVALHGGGQLITAGMEMYNAYNGGRKVNGVLREMYRGATGDDVRALEYVDDSIGLIGGGAGVIKVGGRIMQATAGIVGGNALFGGTASAGVSLIQGDSGYDVGDAFFQGARVGAITGPMSGLNNVRIGTSFLGQQAANTLGRGVVAGSVLGGWDVGNQLAEVNGDFGRVNYSQAMTVGVLGGLGTSASSSIGHSFDRLSHLRYSASRPGNFSDFLTTDGVTNMIFAGPAFSLEAYYQHMRRNNE